MRNMYAIQPYEVGTKKHKGLAIYIPSDVKKKCRLDTSSIFHLEVIKNTNQIILYGPNTEVGIGHFAYGTKNSRYVDKRDGDSIIRMSRRDIRNE